jgi:predicted HicB family RNase H-like nuclease
MKHINLRLPDDLHAAVSRAAEADRRSLNSMIIVMIEKALRWDAIPLPPEGGSPLA